jgi:hypothetical protein
VAKPHDPNYDTLEEKRMDLDPPQFTKPRSLIERIKNGAPPRAVDLDAVGLDAVSKELGARPKAGPEAFAQPHIRAMREATREADAMAVNPQRISKAGELMQASYNALAAEVRKVAADEVAHVLELQKRCEQQAKDLEQAGKDLAVVLSATNNTVNDMFDASKRFAARKRNLEEQLVANGKKSIDEPDGSPDEPMPPEAAE